MFSSSNYRALCWSSESVSVFVLTHCEIRSRHSLHFFQIVFHLGLPSQSLSVHFPAGETSVISRPGMDVVVAVGERRTQRQALITDQTF